MRLVLVICAVLMICAAGCRGGGVVIPADEAALPGQELPLASVLRFSDVPAPRGFDYLAGVSWTYVASGGVRFAELHYRGKAPLQRVVDFFEEQMPISGWQKTVSLGLETKPKLIFKHTKKSERCTVVVERRGSYTYAVIEVD
jgi:hypothetical protein